MCVCRGPEKVKPLWGRRAVLEGGEGTWSLKGQAGCGVGLGTGQRQADPFREGWDVLRKPLEMSTVAPGVSYTGPVQGQFILGLSASLGPACGADLRAGPTKSRRSS